MQFFIDKVNEGKYQNFFEILEPRTIKSENGYEDMIRLLSKTVGTVEFSQHVQQNTTKLEELESNIDCLKCGIVRI